MPLAVAVLVHPERRRRLGVALFLRPAPSLRGPHRPRVRPPRGSVSPGSAAPWRRARRRSRAAWPARRFDDLGVEVVGERVDRVDDHLGLVDQQPPVGQRFAHRLVQPRSRARVASLVLRWAPARVCLVWWAHQFAVEVAPAVGLDLDRLAVRGDPGFELGHRRFRRVISTIASRVSAGAIDHAGTSRTSLSASSIRVIADLIGWLVMGLFSHSPPTFKVARKPLWRSPSDTSPVDVSPVVERKSTEQPQAGNGDRPRAHLAP